MNFDLEEGQRQMVLLAIADALGEIAKIFHGEEMFAEFKRLNSDRVKAERAPMTLGPLVAQNDDPELLEWLAAADRDGW